MTHFKTKHKSSKPPTLITPEQLAATGSEHGEQAALFCWAAGIVEFFPQVAWMFAIPNGGERNPIVAARLKAEGVKEGVADICLPVRVGTHQALWIELKRPETKALNRRAGKASASQIQFGEHVVSQGMAFAVCIGWEQAVQAILCYLAGQLSYSNNVDIMGELTIVKRSD